MNEMRPRSRGEGSRRNGIIQGRTVEAIRRAIFSGEITPGEPLREMHLAREHGVSQSTVREALARLEHAGLVRRYSGKGSFVVNLSQQEVGQHLRLRTILETLAACEAAQNLTEQSLKGLEARLYSMEEAASRNDYLGVAEGDLEFHRYVWELSGDRTLCRILDRIVAPLFATTSMQQSMRYRKLSNHIRAHETVVTVLRTGDAEEIGIAIRGHIATYHDFLGLRDFQLREIAPTGSASVIASGATG